ncbi:hypothetical protein SAMN05661008_01532 [Alkalithermobacter thermoalcaliphilus JW-YL-7 = DSM 7308]|uniref:Uncharacterized protein n=1 Tax=Alkalithermobacter thermoalcaliphilus JW-YL-7 = DSM 7308 TaxID=1121328 RepID=A0A150FR11_CLOPD|nr:hypothetical protein JWYL7_1083 [[Clostridium] paradoxum JW-YL-7 = DSM 7308]SHL13777.1 hypothetical protein SAMN05661008_01532 [[Clostridium] paradoxum JW-YL-7 = DSM 7308]
MKKCVAIELDKMRNLRFGVNAFCQIRDMLGKPLTSLTEYTEFNELRVLFYCGLIWEDKELTLEKTGNIMDEGIEKHGLDYIVEKLSEAIELALPNNSKKK